MQMCEANVEVFSSPTRDLFSSQHAIRVLGSTLAQRPAALACGARCPAPSSHAGRCVRAAPGRTASIPHAGRRAQAAPIRTYLCAAAAAEVAESRAVVLQSIPVQHIDEGKRDALASDLEKELANVPVRWDEDPDKFDDVALACLQRHVPDLLAELRGVLDDPASPSTMLLTGLPQEDANKLPATPKSPPVKKEGQVAEAMLLGFSRVWGRAAGRPNLGPAGICTDIIEMPDHIFSSTAELTMHRDYGIAAEDKVPNIRLIYCLRNDKGRQVQTLVADNRDVLAAMDPKDVELLRRVPVKISVPKFNFGESKQLIQGSDDLPALTLFDIAAFGGEADITSEDPAAVEAYHRASDAAMSVAQSVRLQPGEMLVINNCRAVHARTKAESQDASMGRWVKVTFANAGAGPGEDRYLQLGL